MDMQVEENMDTEENHMGMDLEEEGMDLDLEEVGMDLDLGEVDIHLDLEEDIHKGEDIGYCKDDYSSSSTHTCEIRSIGSRVFLCLKNGRGRR